MFTYGDTTVQLTEAINSKHITLNTNSGVTAITEVENSSENIAA
jgi:hypothetical protein